MAQETQIKVKIDDNEALQALREMAALVSQISDGLSGLKMAPDAVPSAPSAPSAPSKTREERDAEKLVEERKKIFVAETKATLQSLTSPQTMSSLTNRFGDMLTNIGKTIPMFGAFAAGTGELLKMYGRSLEAREARLGEVLNLETLEAEMSGVIEGPAKETAQARAEKLAKLGLDPTQTRQLMLGVAGATGLKTTAGDLSEDRLMRLAAAERTGVSAQSVAGLAGALAQNFTQSIGTALDTSLVMRNIAENELDLRGSGVERFLSQLGGFVEGLTARGIQAQPAATGRTLAGIRRATGQRGQRPLQIMQALSGVSAGAFSQISAPLQEIAQMSVFADIMSRSSDLLGAMQEAEALQADPEAIPRIISRTTGGGRLTQATIGAISGIGTRDARGLMRGITADPRTKDRMTPAQVAAQLNLNAQQAEQTRQTIRAVRTPEGEKVFEQMIKVSGEMERNTISMSENVKLLTNITDAQVAISSAVTSAVNGIGQALDKLSDYLP